NSVCSISLAQASRNNATTPSVGRSSRVSTFWAKFSPSEEWTALPRAMFAVAGSGTFRPCLNHQRIWQDMKQRTWLGESSWGDLVWESAAICSDGDVPGSWTLGA